MTIAVGSSGAGQVWLAEPGEPTRLLTPTEAAATIEPIEGDRRPRWVLTSAATTYPVLRGAGVRLDRCVDLEHVEAILLSRAGHAGQPAHLGAALARMRGTPIPDPPSARDDRPALFDPAQRSTHDEDPGCAALELHADQQRRLAADPGADRLGLLVAADSVGALLAVEMTEAGIPWDAAVHDALLTDLLGTRPSAGARPPRLASLAEDISAAFGHPVNPDSPADLLAAFHRDGIDVPSTRRWVLRGIDHPAVPTLLEYKELARVHTANGWTWLEAWVRERRFRPRYLPAGVVTGRWAAHGGGALQIPRRLRRAVIADPGMTLVVADAAQLEPRILAAMSRDPGMLRAASAADMYASLANESFAGRRAAAKVGLLGAMYGQVGGGAAAPLRVLRARYPDALTLLEQAAQDGERGRLVHTHLGRTCPPRTIRDPSPAQERARGRFTRNFIVQGTAAEWASSTLALLRRRLFEAYGDTDAARIVFFQHDEVMVHCEQDAAGQVAALIEQCAAEATRLLFGYLPVVLPMQPVIADCYADAH